MCVGGCSAGGVQLQQCSEMNTNSIRSRAVATLAVVSMVMVVLGSPAVCAAETPAKPSRPAIYDERADGAKQVDAALTRAKKENKRVLLMFGANWCGWCHRLHTLFESDSTIAAKLRQDFVVVMIDVNKGHNAELDARYGKPTQFGLPVLVVLDADGKVVKTQDTGKLEEGDHHDPVKVLTFLKEFSPRR